MNNVRGLMQLVEPDILGQFGLNKPQRTYFKTQYTRGPATFSMNWFDDSFDLYKNEAKQCDSHDLIMDIVFRK